jgi:hypothetical protein
MSLIATVGPTGGVKNRLNIVDFVKNEKFFTLYVRSLGRYNYADSVLHRFLTSVIQNLYKPRNSMITRLSSNSRAFMAYRSLSGLKSGLP